MHSEHFSPIYRALPINVEMDEEVVVVVLFRGSQRLSAESTKLKVKASPKGHQIGHGSKLNQRPK